MSAPASCTHRSKKHGLMSLNCLIGSARFAAHGGARCSGILKQLQKVSALRVVDLIECQKEVLSLRSSSGLTISLHLMLRSLDMRGQKDASQSPVTSTTACTSKRRYIDFVPPGLICSCCAYGGDLSSFAPTHECKPQTKYIDLKRCEVSKQKSSTP